jgi:hypothetical protein
MQLPTKDVEILHTLEPEDFVEEEIVDINGSSFVRFPGSSDDEDSSGSSEDNDRKVMHTRIGRAIGKGKRGIYADESGSDDDDFEVGDKVLAFWGQQLFEARILNKKMLKLKNQKTDGKLFRLVASNYECYTFTYTTTFSQLKCYLKFTFWAGITDMIAGSGMLVDRLQYKKQSI